MARTAGQLVIRADATPAIGAGHVMRCLGLAEAWLEHGGRATFAGDIPPGLRERLASAGMDVAALPHRYPDPGDARGIADLLGRLDSSSPAWIVVDGYDFDERYLAQVKSLGAHVLAMDDMAALSSYPADLVLNQGVGAAAKAYPDSSDAVFLLGESYRLLRREFVARAGRGRVVPERAERLMVIMGGADSRNVTGRVLAALAQGPCREMGVDVVVGPANRHAAALQDLAAALDMPGLRLLAGASMPEVMAGADLAVSAGGGTLCELAFMGVPALAVVVAENQEREARNLDSLGAVRCLGRWENLDGEAVAEACAELALDVDARRAMADVGRRVVDGRGADRVVAHMLSERTEQP